MTPHGTNLSSDIRFSTHSPSLRLIAMVLTLATAPQPVMAQSLPAQSAPSSLEQAPSLDMSEMLEAIRQQQAGQHQSAQPQSPLPQFIPPSGPASTTSRPLPTLPNRLDEPLPETAPSSPQTGSVLVSPPISHALPGTLPAISETPPSAIPTGDDTKTDHAAAPQASPEDARKGIPPGGLPDPAAMLGIGNKALDSMPQLKAMAKAFAQNAGMGITSPTARAEQLAISFVDFLFRQDQPRVRALVGLPFYADNFQLNTEAELDKMLGKPGPIDRPPKPMPEARAKDRLIGITTMRISELRHSDFYIGDRGADLLGLRDDDYFVHLNFERGDGMAAMIVYVRHTKDGGMEVAGFYD